MRFDQRFQPLTVFLPILLVESRTVLNQKYCVSLESSHSGMVEFSLSRGQEDQGRESYRYAVNIVHISYIVDLPAM